MTTKLPLFSGSSRFGNGRNYLILSTDEFMLSTKIFISTLAILELKTEYICDYKKIADIWHFRCSCTSNISYIFAIIQHGYKCTLRRWKCWIHKYWTKRKKHSSNGECKWGNGMAAESHHAALHSITEIIWILFIECERYRKWIEFYVVCRIVVSRYSSRSFSCCWLRHMCFCSNNGKNYERKTVRASGSTKRTIMSSNNSGIHGKKQLQPCYRIWQTGTEKNDDI